MIIKKVAFGNFEKSFYEDKLSPGFNIIYSDDNQKGKTVFIQAMMFALGNDPIFPEGFCQEYKDYYYYVCFEHGNTDYEVLRKASNFFVRSNEKVEYFSTNSDFKFFFDEKIFALPKILKDSREKTIDLFLFYQTFFVGQDKRDTSKIALSGYYNKDDFLEMLFSLKGFSSFAPTVDSVAVKKELFDLKEKKGLLSKKYTSIKKISKTASSVLSSIDKNFLKMKLDEAEKINDNIVNSKKERSRTFLRLYDAKNLKDELNALNKTIETGEIKCLDCGSRNIGFDSSDKKISFELTNTDIRKTILDSIDKKILALSEELGRLDEEIETFQSRLKDTLQDEEVNYENVILYKNELIGNFEFDKQITEVDKRIDTLEKSLIQSQSSSDQQKKEKINFKNSLVKTVSEIYKTIDAETGLTFMDLFTTAGTTYSGSEGNIFYLSKIYTFAETFKHSFPLIVDSFRSDELSTNKESIVLELFKKLPNQKIFTATLKNQEMNKYDDIAYINRLNYSEIPSSHILGEKHTKEFSSILERFGIKNDVKSQALKK